MKRLFVLAVFLNLSAPGWTAGSSPPSQRATIVLTSKENGTEPQSTFLCDGRIHGYLRLPAPATGSHTLEGAWTLPNGQIAAHSRDAVDFGAGGRSTAYVWFAFPERGGLLNLDPEADVLRLNSSGRWTLDVLWDGRPLLSSSFPVRCL